MAVSAPPISCSPRLTPGMDVILMSRNSGRGCWVMGEGVERDEGEGEEKERCGREKQGINDY